MLSWSYLALPVWTKENYSTGLSKLPFRKTAEPFHSHNSNKNKEQEQPRSKELSGDLISQTPEYYYSLGCVKQWPPKRSMSQSLEPEKMLPHMTEETSLMWLRLLRWGDYPGSSDRAPCNHRVLLRGRQESQSQRWRYDNWSRARSDTGPQGKEYGQLLGSEKWKQILFRSSWKDHSPPANSLWTSGLQNSKIINECCSRLLNWYLFVIASIGN